LRQVHDSLVETVQEVIRINADGVKARAEISHDLRQMREAMTSGSSLSTLVKEGSERKARAALGAPGLERVSRG